jgi:hypothetical protein
LKVKMPPINFNKLNTIGIAKAAFILFLILGTVIFLIARSRVNHHTNQLAAYIQSTYDDGIKVQIMLDETLPIDIEVPLAELIDLESLFPSEIPISVNVPISTSVRINQVITVPVRLPVGGTVNIEVPLNTTIPVEQIIPIKTKIGLDPSAFGSANQMIRINREIPVEIPLNLVVFPAELGLEREMESITGLLNTLRLIFLLGKADTGS